MSTIISDESASQLITRTLPRTVENSYSEASLARRMLRPAKQPEKISYEFTDDIALLHQYYRLREEMFISVWGLQHFSGTKEANDDISQIMVARLGRQCIAGGRLTISTPSQQQQMPMEKEDFKLAAMFPELNLSQRTYGEFSRLAILPDFRGGLVFPEIARRFIRRAIAEGVEYAFNIAPMPLARNYRQTVQLFGLKWDVRHDVKVPDREEYEGIHMVLSVMDLTRFSRHKQSGGDMVAIQKQAELLVD